jgi:LysR family glycine cleavage system transcriptional activator
MSKLPSKLPPMSAVRVFEAAARHQSFTRAAEELGMTQAAVSYQIKILEDRIGAPLFTRLPRQVALTEKGLQLAPAVTDAFEALRVAFAGVEDTVQTLISLTTTHTFASNWLVPRLGHFRERHPTIAVQVDISLQTVDLASHDFDLAIRSGKGDWPDLEKHHLFENNVTPVCSPDLLRGFDLREPADLLKLPLMSPGDPWWHEWFALAGVENANLTKRADYSLGSQQFEGMAAVAGQGVAIVNVSFFREELASGRLVQPFDLMLKTGSYWLVYPKARKRYAKIRAFQDWIFSEVAADEDKVALNAQSKIRA